MATVQINHAFLLLVPFQPAAAFEHHPKIRLPLTKISSAGSVKTDNGMYYSLLATYLTSV